jgi:hypothetical protein
MNNKAELELLDKVKQGLAEQCDKLPEETLGRLQVMRRGALSEAAVPPRFFNQTIWGVPFAPVSAALSAGVLGVVLFVMPGSPLQQYMGDGAGEVNDSADVVDDVDVLMSVEDIEFLENLEIYEWLDAEYG